MVGSRKQKHAIKVLTAQVDALRSERHVGADRDNAHSLGVALFELSSELRHRSRMLPDYNDALTEGIEVLSESSQLQPRAMTALGSMLAWRAWLRLQGREDQRAREDAEACAALLQNPLETEALDPVQAAEALVTSSRVLTRCGQHDASLEVARLAEGFAAEADQPAEFERLSCMAALSRCSTLQAMQDHDAARVTAHEAAHHAKRALDADANGRNTYVAALGQHAIATATFNEQGPHKALPFAESAVDWFEHAEKLGYKSNSMDHTSALTTLMRVHLALDSPREAKAYANRLSNNFAFRLLRTSDSAELQSHGQAVVSALVDVGKMRDAQLLAKSVNKRTGAPS